MRDRNSADQALQIQTLVWSFVGGLIGVLFGYLIARATGWPVLLTISGGFLLGGGAVFLVVNMIGRAAAHAVVSTIAPSGRGTPSQPDYSLADAHITRARYNEALAEYRRQAELDSDEPETYLRMARLYRDRLRQPEESIRLFQHAAAVAHDTGIELLAVRELVELFVIHLNAPARALPVLARLADQRSGSPTGEWARSELSTIKQRMSESA